MSQSYCGKESTRVLNEKDLLTCCFPQLFFVFAFNILGAIGYCFGRFLQFSITCPSTVLTIVFYNMISKSFRCRLRKSSTSVGWVETNSHCRGQTASVWIWKGSLFLGTCFSSRNILYGRRYVQCILYCC